MKTKSIKKKSSLPQAELQKNSFMGAFKRACKQLAQTKAELEELTARQPKLIIEVARLTKTVMALSEMTGEPVPWGKGPPMAPLPQQVVMPPGPNATLPVPAVPFSTTPPVSESGKHSGLVRGGPMEEAEESPLEEESPEDKDFE